MNPRLFQNQEKPGGTGVLTCAGTGWKPVLPVIGAVAGGEAMELFQSGAWERGGRSFLPPIFGSVNFR